MCAQQRSAWASASEDSDQTVWMPRLIRCLRWAHRSFCWFCHEVPHMLFLFFLRTIENYPFIITKYNPCLFHCVLITVNFLNIQTPKKFVVITLKFELCGSTIE